MHLSDIIISTFKSFRGHKIRTLLIIIAVAIGVAAVIVLTSLGEGARRYVQNEFATLGTELLIIFPGRSETAGAGAMISTTTRDLTLNDARAIQQQTRVRRMAPIVVGAAAAGWKSRQRDITVLGTNHDLLTIRHWKLKRGQFLPEMELHRSLPVCVIGVKLKQELFDNQSALGEWLRLDNYRCRIIGIMATEGRSIGMDVDELVIVPVAFAQQIFNASSLFRIVAENPKPASIEQTKDDILKVIRHQHQGEEDVTVISQDAVLQTFNKIFNILTMAVGGIAAISLLVAGILIMNVILVSVYQRTAEIGLLKAIGASPHIILSLFIAEGVTLCTIGAGLGWGLSFLGRWAIHFWLPAFNPVPPSWAVIAALALAVTLGVIFSYWPARRASRMDPVIALSQH
jgi:putative ABC transport system permease protein